MKKPSDDLFRIIKSLSPSEKRYFKVITSQRESGKASAYHALFDAIDAQESFNEAALLELNRDHRFTKNLSMAKIYLQESIIKALCSFHADSSAGITIEEKITGAALLKDRGLGNISSKLLGQAEKIALRTDNTIVRLRLLMQAMGDRQFDADDNSEEVLDAIYAEQLEHLHSLRSEIDVKWLRAMSQARHVNYGLARSDTDRDRIQQILDHEIAQRDPASLPSDRLRHILFNIHSLCHIVLGNYQQAFESGKESLRLWELISLPTKDKRKHAVKLHNFAMRCTRAQQLDELKLVLDKLRVLCEGDQSMRLFHFESVKIIEMSYLAQKFRYRDIVEMSPSIESEFQDLRLKVNGSSRMAIFFCLSSVSIFVGEFNLALHHINNLLNDEASFPDLYNITRLINLVVHVELGHLDLMSGLVRSTRRFLTKRERLFNVEDILLRRMAKIPDVAGTDSEKEFYARFAQDLRDATADGSGATTFEYFDFGIWAQSKAEGRPMAELMRAAAT